MKKLLLLIAAVVASSFLANAQLMWKICGGDSKGESFLFGTHHVAPVSLIDSIAPMRRAILDADLIIGEMNMMEAQEDISMKLATMMMAPADSTLNRVLTAQQLDSLNSVLKKYTGGQLTVDMVSTLKPAAITLQLAAIQNMVVFPEFNGTDQLDTKIQQIGLEAGKPIKGLETAEQQITLLMNDPISVQAEALMKTVREDDGAIEKAKSLANAYLNQDLDAICNIMDSEMDEEGGKALIIDRNYDWLSQLRTLLPNNKLFIAVGVGHLVGPDGLISQLRKLGYTLQPAD